MGVNANLSLPPKTHVEDVLDALAALAGNKAEDVPHFNYGQRWLSCEWPKAAKVRARPSGSGSPEYTYLHFACHNDPLGFQAHEGQYSFEHETKPGWRNLYVSSTAFWIAACARLAEMFGGELVAQDCDDEVVLTVPRSVSGIAALERTFPHPDQRGDELFCARQQMCHKAEPLTETELRKADKLAAYKVDTWK
jgi:hypothetical protein